eukprot:CAMPEP_0181118094 /NCGR_PEP_ID=MMETSP1071-20121207/22887_1 /TAXON_ID=35127 /ORGANISM="Thalassiosira sp., Strain NH16" /LENGTH=273 /DNA_ID=CAMNT_0023202555 /DNA_START=146 /DNA_END=967 /DNA_ORIENTATION=+
MKFLKLSSATILSFAAAASAAPSCPSTLDASHKVNDMITMYYAIVPSDPADADNGLLCARMEYEGDQWVGLGISADGKMVPSRAIIGLPDDNSVRKYALNGMSPDLVVPAEEDRQTLMDTSIVQSDGMTTMSFARMLVEEDEIEIKASGENIFIYARGSANSPLAYHGGGDEHRGVFRVDFKAEEEAPPPVEDDAGDVATTGATAAAAAAAGDATTVAATAAAADATSTAATTAAPGAEGTTTTATTAPDTSSGHVVAASSLMAISLATMFLV